MNRKPAELPVTDRGGLGPPIVADTHVHIYDCFDLDSFFDAAAHNFETAARDHTADREAAGALLLTEVQGASVFDSLRTASATDLRRLGDWQAYSTPDPRALLFEKPSSIPLLLIAGRQIRVRTGLEVLALGSLEAIANGMAIEDTLEKTRQAGALPVVPWGFGKWTLARGRRIRELIDKEGSDAFCLGDVGGRWRGLSEPALLTQGRSLGYSVLPGSDPLPFPRETRRAGSSGVILPIALDLEHATEDLLSSLRQVDADVATYMELETLGPFVQHQLLMQARKLWPTGQGSNADRPGGV